MTGSLLDSHPFLLPAFLKCGSVPWGRRGGEPTKLPGLGSPKGACGPTVFYMFSFSAVSVFVDCINGSFETKPNSLCNYDFV